MQSCQDTYVGNHAYVYPSHLPYFSYLEHNRIMHVQALEQKLLLFKKVKLYFYCVSVWPAGQHSPSQASDQAMLSSDHNS